MSKKIFLLLIFSVFVGKESTGEKMDKQNQNVQTLIHQFETNEFSQNGQENAEKKILEILKSFLKIQCEIAKFGTENAKHFTAIKEQTKQICATEKTQKFDIQKLTNAITAAFEKEGAKLVEAMKKGEHTVKVTVDGAYGTLAELLPKSMEFRPYWTGINMLCLMNEQMDDGPGKKVIAKFLNATTVTGDGSAIANTVMPSDLMKIMIALWHILFHNVTGMGKIGGPKFLNQSFGQGAKSDRQEIAKRRNFDQIIVDGQQFGRAIPAISGHPLRRRRRRNLNITARQLANLFHALTVVVLALNLLRVVLRNVADQLDQPPIFMMVALAATIRYFMTLD